MNYTFIGVPMQLGCGTDGSKKAPEVLLPLIEELPYSICTCMLDCPEGPREKDANGIYNLNDCVKVCANLCDLVENTDDFPIVIGGDHSIGYGSLAGSSAKFGAENIAVIWVDAHTDINTEKTTESGNVHGMPLAAAAGLCGEELSSVGKGKVKLDPRNIHYIGVRSIDDPEEIIIKEQGCDVHRMSELKKDGIPSVLKDVIKKCQGKKVHLSLDVDFMDPSAFYATGLNIPDGPSADDTEEIMVELIKAIDVVSMDFVEYNPNKDKGSDKDTLIDIIRASLESLEQK